MNAIASKGIRLDSIYHINWSESSFKSTFVGKVLGDYMWQGGAMSLSLFKYLQVYEPNEIRGIFGWFRTRAVDRPSMSVAVGTSYGFTIIGGILFAMLWSKVQTWINQLTRMTNDEGEASTSLPDDWIKGIYDASDPVTYIIDLFETAFGAISSTDEKYIKNIVQILLQHKIGLPEESFHLAMKIIGSASLPVLDLDLRETLYYVKHHFYMFGNVNDISHTPKIDQAKTEDVMLLEALKTISKWFKTMPTMSIFKEYQRNPVDREGFERFLLKYKHRLITLDDLVGPNNLHYLWQVWLATNEADGTTGWNLISHAAAKFGRTIPSSPIWERDTAVFDASNNEQYISFPIPQGLSTDLMIAGFLFGYYLLSGTDGLGNEYDQNGGGLENDVFVFQERIYINDEGKIISRLGLGAAAVTSLTENYIYALLNKSELTGPQIDFGSGNIDQKLGLNILTPIEIIAAPSVTEQTDVQTYLTEASAGAPPEANYKRELEDILLDYLPRHQLELNKISKHWAKKYVDTFVNPILSKEAPKKPDRTSNLEAGTWSKSSDKDELQKYINDLESEAEYFGKLGEDDQVSNRKKTIEAVRSKLESMKEDSQQKIPESKHKGDDQLGVMLKDMQKPKPDGDGDGIPDEQQDDE